MPGYLYYCAAPLEVHDWTFIVGKRFFVALPRAASPETIDALRFLADDGAVALESLVELVPTEAEDAAFAIVALSFPDRPANDEATIGVVVRGMAAVDVFSIGGRRRFSDQGAKPFVLANFRSVTAIAIGDERIPTYSLPELLEKCRPPTAFVERAGQLIWSLDAAPQSFVDGDTVLRTPALARESEVDFDEETVLAIPGTRPPALGQSHGPDPVLITPPPESASSATRSSASGSSTSGGSRYRFRVGGSQIVTLTSEVFIGRNPRSPRISAQISPQFVTVESPLGEVSGTHVKIAQEGQVVVVTDLESMNGTRVSIPGARTLRLRPSESIVVTRGTVLEIGDGNTIEILGTAP